jgi:steroid delta-isomerase-like uncharacterized protein
MSAEEIRALERRYFEECNKGKAAAMAVIDETCATNFVYHNATGMDIHGLKGFKQSENEIFTALPDLRFTVDDIIAEGDKVAVRWTVTGTHKGAFMGILPTNKKITYWAIEINRLSNGKIVESWSRTDTLSLMQQLGVVPTPKKEK